MLNSMEYKIYSDVRQFSLRHFGIYADRIGHFAIVFTVTIILFCMAEFTTPFADLCRNGGIMSNHHRPLEELNLMDDFLINAVAADPAVGIPFCQTVLSVLLQRPIRELDISVQRTIPAATPTMRGIRMDVEITEKYSSDDHFPAMTIYDMEPHLQKEDNYPRHNRFYQARIDSRNLKSGEKNFAKLPNLYIISITDYDPFGYDYMMYTVRNHCEEIPGLSYDDGLHFLYFYTRGTKGGCREIQDMLRYFQESTEENVTNDDIHRIHDYVSTVKIQPKVRDAYMRFDEIIAYYAEEAAEEAAEETMVQCILELLEDCGEIPAGMKETLKAQKDVKLLKQWFKLAAHANSITDFMDQAGITLESQSN